MSINRVSQKDEENRLSQWLLFDRNIEILLKELKKNEDKIRIEGKYELIDKHKGAMKSNEEWVHEIIFEDLAEIQRDLASVIFLIGKEYDVFHLKGQEAFEIIKKHFVAWRAIKGWSLIKMVKDAELALETRGVKPPVKDMEDIKNRVSRSLADSEWAWSDL